MKYFILYIGLLSIANRAHSQTCSILYNIDYYGNDLFSIQTIVPSIDACCQLCAITERCTAWTYLIFNRACWLKHSVGQIINGSPGPIFSGTVQYTSPSYTSLSITIPPSPISQTTSFYTTITKSTPSISFTSDSTTTKTTIGSLDDCNAQFNSAALEAHNSYRAMHHVSPLTLDPEIIDVATAYANKLGDEIKTLVHSYTPGYGENLALWFSSASTDCASFGRQFVKMWYDEISAYDYNNPGFSSETGHFTQVVWKSSTKLGCGISIKDGKTFGVCNYTPPGNYLGKFPENVLPK